MTDIERWHACCHEAGHCCVASVLGRKVFRVTADLEFNEFIYKMMPDPDLQPVVAIASMLGGPTAERMAAGAGVMVHHWNIDLLRDR